MGPYAVGITSSSNLGSSSASTHDICLIEASILLILPSPEHKQENQRIERVIGGKIRNYDGPMDILFFCFVDLHLHPEAVVYQPKISVPYAPRPIVSVVQLAVSF
jgi:hypothetical protein